MQDLQQWLDVERVERAVLRQSRILVPDLRTGYQNNPHVSVLTLSGPGWGHRKGIMLTNKVPLIRDTSASTLATPKLSAVSNGTSLQSSHRDHPHGH